MKKFLDFSIRNKLILVMLIVTTITIGIGFTVIAIDDINSFKEDLVSNTTINAHLIGEYCIVPITFRDQEEAKKIIEKIQTLPSINTACIYDESGNLFASFQKRHDKSIPVTVTAKGKYVFENDNLKVFIPIKFNNIFYGTVYLKVSTDLLSEKINRHLMIMISLMLGLIILSYFIASRLQAAISKPILKLAHTTKKITQDSDFSLRVKKHGDDEIGLLYDSFNEMLTQLNQREEERNKAIELLREGEAKYRSIVDTATEGIWVLGPDTLTTFVNTRMTEMLGYSTEELIGHPLSDFMFAEDVPDHQNKMENRRLGIEENYERRFLRKDGETVWTHASATPIFDDKNHFKGTCAMFTDITLRKLSEEKIKKLNEDEKRRHEELIAKNIELKRARIATLNIIEDLSKEIDERKQAQQRISQLAAIVEFSDDAIIGKTLDGIITSWNKGAEKIYGYSESEMIGESISILLEYESSDEIPMILEQIKSGTHIEHFETIRKRKDGQLINVSLTISPVMDSDGNLIGASTIARDITELKQAEEERRINLWFMESLDKINRAIQGGKDIEHMMSDVLNEVLSIYDSDRTFLMYPCDPNADTWKVPMERTKPEYPGVLAFGIEMTMDPQVAGTLQLLLSTDGPVQFGPDSPYPIPTDVSEQFGFKCFMSLAIYPKVGKPWQFGIHQCSHARTWSNDEERLFKEIGRRLADGMSSLLMLRNLLDSERKYRLLVENSPYCIHQVNLQGRLISMNPVGLKMMGVKDESEIKGMLYLDAVASEDKEQVNMLLSLALKGQSSEFEFRTSNGHYFQSSFVPITDSEGSVLWLMGLTQDITERKRNSAINAARLFLLQYAATHSLEELLEESVNQAEILTGSRIGFYHFVDDNQISLTLQNWSTRTKKDFCKAEGKGLHYEIDKAGVWVECVYQRKPVIHNDYASLPNRKGMPEGHADVKRELVVPVVRGDKIKAILGVGNKATDYLERDVETISLIADLAWEVTERKRSEVAIQKSEAQLNEAQRIAQIGSWELDIVNNILRWSDEIFRIFEIDPKEFGASYEDFLNAIHPDDRDAVDTAYSNSLKTRTPYAIDHRLLFGDGRVKYVHEQCETIFNTDGKPLRSMGTVQDITEDKLAEEALKKSEEKYRTLIQKIQTAVVVHRPDTKILTCNPTAEKLLGLSEDQLLGKKAYDPDWHFFKEDGTVLPFEEYPVNKVLATFRELRNYVVGIHRPNNESDVWVLVNAVPVWGNENELTQVIITFSDITQRKQIEDELRQSEERYRTLVEQAMDGIFISDPKGFYIDVNRSGCNMLGYTRDQLLRLSMRDLIQLDEQKTAPIQFEKLWSGKTALAERNLIRHDGSLLPVEISAIMLSDGRFLGIVRDITERKQSEAALNERVKHSQSLVRLSKNLELAQTYSQVLSAALNEVKSILGYQTLWVYLLSEDKKYFNALVARGDYEDVVMSPEGTAILPISGDRMLEEIAEAKDIVIVEDARTDERTNKKIVAALGNRTLINVPIYLFDKHLGTVGTGTFDPEGIRVPTHSEQEYLLAMASHLAVTLDRLHLLIERQEAEKALIRLNRELKAISNCNQSLLRAEDEQSLLNEICRIICEEAGYNFAWVGYIDDPDSKTLRPVAWAGNDEYLKTKEKLDWSEEIDCGLKPAQKVIQNGNIIYVQDFNTDTNLESWCQKAIQRGYRSGMALPLKGENSQVFGVLLIYSINENVITPDEIRLIEELANDLAFGIITLQTRAERKRVEKELELHRDHLQELVNVRTDELDKVNKKLLIEFEKEKEFERMLQHSLEKEKELSELKSRFISTTSHEFRTPLTTVRVSAEMIQRYRKRWTEDKLDEFLDKIKKSVDYLTKLLDDILTISRSESGKISLNRETIDFHSFCVDVIDEAKVSITEKHDLIFKYALKEVKYNLDPKLMNFILLNLLSNAIKYSPNGGKIELTLKQSRGKLVIVVKDQGIGIPSDDLKHLFEPFHRAKNTSSISGTGLGLSIVKRAVELHGGIITVKSVLGTGTTFTVNIPLTA